MKNNYRLTSHYSAINTYQYYQVTTKSQEKSKKPNPNLGFRIWDFHWMVRILFIIFICCKNSKLERKKDLLIIQFYFREILGFGFILIIYKLIIYPFSNLTSLSNKRNKIGDKQPTT